MHVLEEALGRPDRALLPRGAMADPRVVGAVIRPRSPGRTPLLWLGRLIGWCRLRLRGGDTAPHGTRQTMPVAQSPAQLPVAVGAHADPGENLGLTQLALRLQDAHPIIER